MDDGLHNHELDPETAEHLINRASKRTHHHTAPPTPAINPDDPLSTLLAAASTPDHDRALAGEQAAITAFLAAQHPPVSARRRTIRRVALAALAALTLGGTAITAAQTGLTTALHPRPSAASTTHASTPPGQTAAKPPTTPPRAGTPIRPLTTRSGYAPGHEQHTPPHPNPTKPNTTTNSATKARNTQTIPNRHPMKSLQKPKRKVTNTTQQFPARIPRGCRPDRTEVEQDDLRDNHRDGQS